MSVKGPAREVILRYRPDDSDLAPRWIEAKDDLVHAVIERTVDAVLDAQSALEQLRIALDTAVAHLRQAAIR